MEKEIVPTPNEIWKILKEVSLSQKETDRRMQETDRYLKETARLFKENQQRHEQRVQESQQRHEQRVQESQQRLEQMIQANKLYTKQVDSRWGNEWGQLVEALIEGNFIPLLNDIGIKVTKANPNYTGRFNGQVKEFDLIATNGKEIVVVETKSSLTQGKVNDFLKVMSLFKEYCSEFSALTVYAGVACLKSSQKVLDYAEERGLFVLCVSGKNAILKNKTGFKPKIFCANQK